MEGSERKSRTEKMPGLRPVAPSIPRHHIGSLFSTGALAARGISQHVRSLLTHGVGYRTVVLFLLLSFPVLAAHGSIRGELDSIKNLLIQGEDDKAIGLVHQVDHEKTYIADEEVELHLYEGILEYELHHRDKARVAFLKAFRLRPDAQLPVPGISPKIVGMAEASRQEVQQERKKAEEDARASRQASTLEEDRRKDGRDEKARLPIVSQPLKESPGVEGTSSSQVRRHALIPALVGGALVVAGGISWGISRGELNKLNHDDSSIVSAADVARIGTQGRNWQTAGISLLSVGAAGLVTAAGMYLLGAPSGSHLSLQLGTDGTSAFVQGRWP